MFSFTTSQTSVPCHTLPASRKAKDKQTNKNKQKCLVDIETASKEY